MSENQSCGEDMAPSLAFQYSPAEKVASVVLQVVGLFLLLSTVLMFVKHGVLRRAENVFHGNILVCSLLLLAVDWYILELGDTGCEVFTLSLLLFGVAGTFSGVCIAIERYKRMVHMITTTIRHYLIWLCTIWLSSLLLILYPSLTRQISRMFTMVSQDPPQPEPGEVSQAGSQQVACVFRGDSHVYSSLLYSVCFLCLVVIMPVVVQLFCYIKVYYRVRTASMNRWMHNAVAECSEHTRVIRPTARKGNIIQVSSGQKRLKRQQSFRLSSREQSILIKGITSVVLVLVCWLPFAALWLKLSMHGFRENSAHQILYVVLLAKASAVLSICHYICLNSKFQRYYFKSTFGRNFRMIKCGSAVIIPEDNVSQATSQVNSTMASATLYTNPSCSSYSSSYNSRNNLVSIQSSRQCQLEPICELKVKECFEPAAVPPGQSWVPTGLRSPSRVRGTELSLVEQRWASKSQQMEQIHKLSAQPRNWSITTV